MLICSNLKDGILIEKPISANVHTILQRLEATTRSDYGIQNTLKDIDTRLEISGNTNRPGNSAAARLDGIKQGVADQVILKLLYLPNLESRFDEVVTQAEGTFEWIFTDPEAVRQIEPELTTTFPEWLESGDGIFHICGKPGAGKSTLMKYICGHRDTKKLLATWSRDHKLLFAKFFFWRIGGDEQKTIMGLIRGLLLQILREVPELSRDLFSRETREKLVNNLQEHSGARLEWNQIAEAFSRLVENYSFSSHSQHRRGIRICLFIDGLDEFDNTKIDQSYGDLVTMLQKWSTNSNGHVKICVSSRIEAPFMEMLDKRKRFAIHRLTERDIELIVKEKLESYPKFQGYQRKSPEECQKLINDIKKSAEGVFLWVVLVIKNLQENLDNDSPIDVLRKLISEMPKDLETLLGRILCGINENLRAGVEVLLAALLRATGTLLSPGDRYPEYAPHYGHKGQYRFSAVSAFLVLRATDKGISMLEDITMDRFNVEKEQWFRDSMDDKEVMNAVCKIVQARCKGLVDIVQGDTYTSGPKHSKQSVKFMHRSVPDFLHTYFTRRAASNLHSDHRATVVFSWAFLVDVKWITIKSKHGASLASFLRGKLDLRWRKQASCEISTGLDPRFINPFICILRQMKLGDDWEDLFHVLVLIERSCGRASKPQMEFIASCAYNGLHEFIGWLLPQTDVLVKDVMWPDLILARSMEGMHQLGSYSHLEVMKTMFVNAADGRIVFSGGASEELVGRPVWYYILREAMKAIHRIYREGNIHRTKRLMADVIELWLRHKANPRVRLQLSEDGRRCTRVSSALDNSEFIAVAADDSHRYSNSMQPGLQNKGRSELSLRDWVLSEKFYNESSLLDILQDDTEDGIQGAQGPENIETDLSELREETGEGDSYPGEKASISQEVANPDVADQIDSTTPMLNRWQGASAMGDINHLYICKPALLYMLQVFMLICYLDLFCIGALGLMIAYFIQYLM